MIFVGADELKTGMRLAKPIYNRDGVMLYERDSKLTRQGIVSIQNFGLIGVFILEPAEPVPPMTKDDIEFERFQMMAVFSVKDILDAVCKQKEAKGMYQFVNQIIKKYGNLNHRITFVQNLRSTDDYVYKHTLNTAILAAMISHRMKMEFKQQLDVVVAALLHDIGSLILPVNIRKKRKSDLTAEDIKKIRTYHYAATQLLDSDYDMDVEVKRMVKGLIYELHLPDQKKNMEIQSKGLDILKVAYTYDVQTAMNFEEKPASEIAAIRHLLKPDNGYNQDAVNALIESINILQPGICVELTNGERGLVIEGNGKDVLTPVVLSFHDNVIYKLSDPYISEQIQIADIMKTMDNRYVMAGDLVEKYAGDIVHMGEKRQKKTY